MADLFTPPLSVTEVDGMTVTVYPQLIHIERGGNTMKYSMYTKTDAIKKFRKEFPLRKHNKY